MIKIIANRTIISSQYERNCCDATNKSWRISCGVQRHSDRTPTQLTRIALQRFGHQHALPPAACLWRLHRSADSFGSAKVKGFTFFALLLLFLPDFRDHLRNSFFLILCSLFRSPFRLLEACSPINRLEKRKA